MPGENSLMYRQDPNQQTRAQNESQLFVARVLSVDYEHKVCSLLDLRNDLIFADVSVMPANASGLDSTDVQMPETGTFCLAAPLFYAGGFSQVGIVSYIVSESLRAQDSIAFRGAEGVEGFQYRKRGTYRKAYPGQKTATYTNGYSELMDSGWDRSGQDLTRDKVDADRHTWVQMTGRRVTYTDASLSFNGPINRPGGTTGATGPVKPRVLPDGSKEYVVYLKPGANLSDRYVSNAQDIIPFAEVTERVQEYSLDYPLPYEILETALFDAALGTIADPWARTTIVQTTVGATGATGPSLVISHDNESFAINQGVDHPNSRTLKAVGPTTGDGVTPGRRAFILERTAGTLVGYNLFDTDTYGYPLKPVLFPYTSAGRFGSDVQSSYKPVVDSMDHTEARLAASALAFRFPAEYNTTRLDVTKEGLTSFEIGSTLPKENIPLSGNYEHPHGAGRSLEGHLVGSLKLVIGKNRDEEDAIDLQALGQTVLRLGADDTSLPNPTGANRRTVLTQMRGQKDKVLPRTLQYWKKSKYGPGDPGDLANKTGFENVSLRAAMDGAAIVRLGARSPLAKRRHFYNGYVDGPGVKVWDVTDPARMDSKSPGRPTYGAGDNVYAFHDLTQVGTPPPNAGTSVSFNQAPYISSGPPVTNMDASGLSFDLHTVQDVLLRLGKNLTSGQSLLMDLAGGLVVALGKDNQGRSVTAALDGGIEITILPNAAGKAMRLNIIGDVDISHQGHLQYNCTGDIITDCDTYCSIAKTDRFLKQTNLFSKTNAQVVNESPTTGNQEGFRTPSGENSLGDGLDV